MSWNLVYDHIKELVFLIFDPKFGTVAPYMKQKQRFIKIICITAIGEKWFKITPTTIHHVDSLNFGDWMYYANEKSCSYTVCQGLWPSKVHSAQVAFISLCPNFFLNFYSWRIEFTNETCKKIILFLTMMAAILDPWHTRY